MNLNYWINSDGIHRVEAKKQKKGQRKSLTGK